MFNEINDIIFSPYSAQKQISFLEGKNMILLFEGGGICFFLSVGKYDILSHGEKIIFFP